MGIRRRAGKGRRKELKLVLKNTRAENRQFKIKAGVTLTRALTVMYAIKAIAGIAGIFSLF